MKPINLLPERHRPRRPTGQLKGSSYFLLGALAVVLAVVVAYVWMLNGINDSKSQVAEAQARAERATGEANQLGGYGDFAKVEQQRVAAVKALAAGRPDWERLVRELTGVLPDGVWLEQANAADSAQSTGGTAPAAAAAAGAGSAGPSLNIKACAQNQSQVAEAIVRLRELQGAVDVRLDSSAKPADKPATATGSARSATCSTTQGRANYEFQAVVAFAPPQASTQSAPPSLGGGS